MLRSIRMKASNHSQASQESMNALGWKFEARIEEDPEQVIIEAEAISDVSNEKVLEERNRRPSLSRAGPSPGCKRAGLGPGCYSFGFRLYVIFSTFRFNSYLTHECPLLS